MDNIEERYQNAVDTLYKIPKFGINTDLKRTGELLDRMGEYRTSNHVIHVAGTNGKGSVCAFLENILRSAGYKTGLFTSPHLVVINERFQINGQPVSNELFLEAYEKLRRVVDEMLCEGYSQPTFFECMTAMAVTIFGEQKADVMIMETGLGGRLDATNLVEHPLACVITSIGMDHMECLGNTLEEIAAEKAGIIKFRVPVIADGSNASVRRIIEQQAHEKDAPCSFVDNKCIKNSKFFDKHIDFCYYYEYDKCVWLHLDTIAAYQRMNAALAVKTILSIKEFQNIYPDEASLAIQNMNWPGRMEWISDSILVDGAHNADGMKQAVKSLRQVVKNRSIVLLFGAVREKNYELMIKELCGLHNIKAVVVTTISSARTLDSTTLADEIHRNYAGRIVVTGNVKEGLIQAKEMLCGDDLLFCTGSLYLIADIKQQFD